MAPNYCVIMRLQSVPHKTTPQTTSWLVQQFL